MVHHEKVILNIHNSIIVYMRWLKCFGVGERQMRREVTTLVVYAPMVFPCKGEEVKMEERPLWIGVRMSTRVQCIILLISITWHDGAIPDDEIWVKRWNIQDEFPSGHHRFFQAPENLSLALALEPYIQDLKTKHACVIIIRAYTCTCKFQGEITSFSMRNYYIHVRTCTCILRETLLPNDQH